MSNNVNNRPVIGVLCYDIDFDIRDAFNFGNKFPFYISAAFVKWIESAGGRVIPIFANRDDKYYKDVMSKINGVLFPSGKFWFNDENGLAAYSAKKIYDIACDMNDKGNFFPLFGITLGFQLFFYAASNGKTDCRQLVKTPYSGCFPFNFNNGYEASTLFGSASPGMLDTMQNEAICSYHSIYLVTDEILKNLGIDNWTILSTAVTGDGIKFITSAEHKKYPFCGVISHVQRPQFENSNLNSRNAIEVSEYFANFFIEQARRNSNSMTDAERLCHSINNFDITHVEPKVPQYRQVYLFKKDAKYPETPNSNIQD